MKNTYELHVVCRCPVSDYIDMYQMSVESDEMIQVESILQVINAVRDEKAFQEDLCRRFSESLGKRVTLVGWHSGVKVTSISEGPSK